MQNLNLDEIFDPNEWDIAIENGLWTSGRDITIVHAKHKVTDAREEREFSNGKHFLQASTITICNPSRSATLMSPVIADDGQKVDLKKVEIEQKLDPITGQVISTTVDIKPTLYKVLKFIMWEVITLLLRRLIF